MGFISHLFSGSKAAATPATPPPPPPAPPAAIAPTFASGTQAGASAATSRMAAAAGAGFDSTLIGSPQGAAPAQTALKTLTGA